MAESLPISGYIDPKSFPFLLNDLHRQGATGSLKVDGDNHQKALYFRGGRILFGSSNDPKDQLGAILIESGKLTEEQLEDVNQKVGPGNPLAKALVDSGIVSQRELSEAARAKVERILSDVLSLTAGSFEFEDGVLPKGAIDLKLSAERLFMAAVRRVSDRGFVLRHLDDLAVVLALKPELREKLPEIESELAGLTDHLDGLSSLKDAAGRAALDEFEAAKIACGLLFLGLAEKGAAPMLVDAAEASPFFVPVEAGSELDLGQSPMTVSEDELPATIGFGMSPTIVDSPAGHADATVVMGELPDFSLPSLSSSPEPDSSHSVVESPIDTPTAPSGPPPLKIIAPPRPAERTRPPAKPSKDDLSALDELLGKHSPEGPLAPMQKPAEDWKPTFLAEQSSRGGKRGGSGSRKMLVVGVGAGVVAVAAAASLWVWSNRGSAAPARVAANASASPAASPSARPTVAASGSPSAPPSASVVPATGAPSPASSTAVTSPTTPAPKATASIKVPSAAPPPVTTAPAAKPAASAASPKPESTTSPKAAAPGKPAPSGAPIGIAEARSLLRKGQFDDAARGFRSQFTSSKSGYSVQILVACSTDTLQKAVSAVQADELYVLTVHYRGKDCYRLGWGLYESQAKATVGARGVPDYFRQGGARPKVVAVAELLQ